MSLVPEVPGVGRGTRCKVVALFDVVVEFDLVAPLSVIYLSWRAATAMHGNEEWLIMLLFLSKMNKAVAHGDVTMLDLIF